VPAEGKEEVCGNDPGGTRRRRGAARGAGWAVTTPLAVVAPIGLRDVVPDVVAAPPVLAALCDDKCDRPRGGDSEFPQPDNMMQIHKPGSAVRRDGADIS